MRLIIFFFLLTAMKVVNADMTEIDARNTVKRFCEAEFGGSIDSRIDKNGMVSFTYEA